MSFDMRQLVQYRNKLAKLIEEVPAIAEELVIGEGVYAVKQAKMIAKNDSPDIVNSGAYRNNFHAGDHSLQHSNNNEHDGSKPKLNGKTYRIDVYNNLDYAKHLEYGFRSHWVPGKWEGNTFVYIKGYKDGGMYVGPKNGYVKGHFTLLRALRRTKLTQETRLKRKLDKKIKEAIERGL